MFFFFTLFTFFTYISGGYSRCLCDADVIAAIVVVLDAVYTTVFAVAIANALSLLFYFLSLSLSIYLSFLVLKLFL